MAEASSRTVTFRVDAAILDALMEAGVSPAEIAREAIRREAERQRRLRALDFLAATPIKGGLGFDAVKAVREDRAGR